jgi:hypothetical protein
MRQFSKPKPESYVLCSGRILLGCDGCGERLILLGLEEDWHSEESTNVFECGCGARLTFDDRVEEGLPRIRELLRGSIQAPRN